MEYYFSSQLISSTECHMGLSYSMTTGNFLGIYIIKWGIVYPDNNKKYHTYRWVSVSKLLANTLIVTLRCTHSLILAQTDTYEEYLSLWSSNVTWN